MAKLETSSVVSVVLHKYMYGAVPPVTLASIDPVESPKHATSVAESITSSGAAG